MDRIYTICILIGIVIPLISLILGSLGEFFDGLFDFINIDFNIEIGGTEICLIPISMQSICAGLLVFGTAGKIIGEKFGNVPAVIIGVILGYQTAVIIQSFMRRLKQVENTTYSREELMQFGAVVVNTIKAGGFGSISIKTEDGITNTYPAKAEDSRDEIRPGIPVEVVSFEKHTAIVKVSKEGNNKIAQTEKQEEK